MPDYHYLCPNCGVPNVRRWPITEADKPLPTVICSECSDVAVRNYRAEEPRPPIDRMRQGLRSDREPDALRGAGPNSPERRAYNKKTYGKAEIADLSLPSGAQAILRQAEKAGV